PTTMATCTPSRTATPISLAIRRTTSASSPTLPPPNASPDSLSRTRRAGLPSASTAMVWVASSLTGPSPFGRHYRDWPLVGILPDRRAAHLRGVRRRPIGPRDPWCGVERELHVPPKISKP